MKVKGEFKVMQMHMENGIVEVTMSNEHLLHVNPDGSTDQPVTRIMVLKNLDGTEPKYGDLVNVDVNTGGYSKIDIDLGEMGDKKELAKAVAEQVMKMMGD